jgi:two-component system, response regulator PdtaR
MPWDTNVIDSPLSSAPLFSAPLFLAPPSPAQLARRLAGEVDVWSNEGGAPGPLKPARGLRVLIIEDEGMIAELYAEVLVGLGHGPCAIARTEDEAVCAAEVCKPDIMLVDYNIIGGSGVGAVRRILATQDIPYILTSGERFEDHAAPRAPAYLQKPFNEQQLIAAISLALEQSQR